MSQYDPNQPQQPQWGAQQPNQPQWGRPGHQAPPKPPKSGNWFGRHKVLTVIGAFVVFIIAISAAAGGGGDSKKADTAKNVPAPATSTAPAKNADETTAAAKPKAKPAEKKKDKVKVVTFKVWGNAPAGALGPMDVTYGSDTENIQGHGLPMTKTLKLSDDAMYYNVTAQLQGSGDIHCSVTIAGKTKTGHAQGGYNICNAQLSGGLFGGWS